MAPRLLTDLLRVPARIQIERKRDVNGLFLFSFHRVVKFDYFTCE